MSGQTIDIPESSYFSVQMLIAADYASTSANVTFSYTGGSSSVSEVRSEPFYSFLTIYKGEIILPSYFTHNDTNFNTSHIFEWVGSLDYSKTLESITFPDTTNLTSGSRLHVFAVSLWRGSGIEVQYLRPTQKTSGDRVQIVEVVVNNAGPEWISGDGVNITIEGQGITTVEPGRIKRLRPGDQKKINVGVIGYGNVTADIIFTGRNSTTVYSMDYVSFGLEEWTSELSSLTKHESPEWFDNAKYGIFIHWGPYAVPGWGNSTPYEVYSEWHWWYSHHRAADTKADVWQYDLDTYGPHVVYDDFFANFTADAFDAKAWVDLFADAGAQYFVFTTKHHDGFAMFDTKETTHRSAIYYGPQRDVLKELFDAAREYQPQLHRGTYFSLPEWYNPDFGPYGFAQLPGNTSTSWPGILARNPYTGAEEPYTGRLNISDFITDLMVPQMELLAYEYDTEIMWCDCGVRTPSFPKRNTANFPGCERKRRICQRVVQPRIRSRPLSNHELALRNRRGQRLRHAGIRDLLVGLGAEVGVEPRHGSVLVRIQQGNGTRVVYECEHDCGLPGGYGEQEWEFPAGCWAHGQRDY